MPRSNTRTLDLGPAGTPVFYALVDHAENLIRPRTLRVKSRLLQPVPDEEQQSLAQGLIASVWWSDPAWHKVLGQSRLGALRIRCGSPGGIFRDVYCDLREGEYNLPPCQLVSVWAAYWKSAPAQDSFPLEVSAEIADGECIESTPMIVSAQGEFAITKGFDPVSQYCPAPPGAYAFDIRGGTAGAIVEDEALYVERAPISGRWLPPTTPILLTSTRGISLRPIVEPDGGGPSWTWWPEVTFFVR